MSLQGFSAQPAPRTALSRDRVGHSLREFESFTFSLLLLLRVSLESEWKRRVAMSLEEVVVIPLDYREESSSGVNYSQMDMGGGGGFNNEVGHDWVRNNDAYPFFPSFSNGSSSGDNDTDIVDYYFFPLAMSIPEAISTAVSLSVIMMATVIGNVLVILSVFTYKPLRNAQNMFLVSLAVADITVAIFVMPFNVAYSIMGRWIFGFHACEMWLTCDVLCCTASILNLCAIALDRYWAIHDPISYGQKRTLNRVLLMIAGVWGASAVISIPPLIGWNDWPETFDSTTPCKLTEERGYIIYSSSGSFYIPLVTMTVVYVKIFLATRKRLRQRTKATAKLQAVKSEMVKLHRLPSEQSKQRKEEPSTCVSCVERGSSSPTNRLSLSGQDDENSFASTTEVPAVGCGAPGGPANDAVAPNAVNSAAALDRNGSAKNKPPRSNFNVNLFVEQKQKISLSKERRAARVLGIVMGVFVVCWLPFFLMYIILPFCAGCYISDRIVNFITWLGYLNSALNPIIYTIFNLDFRKAFARLLCGGR